MNQIIMKENIAIINITNIINISKSKKATISKETEVKHKVLEDQCQLNNSTQNQ